MTSFVAAAKLRSLFGEKKTGHTGTLDPMATGVLPVAFGGATKFIELIASHDKTYKAEFVLGKTTDTLDITGTVLSETKVLAKKEDVQSVLEQFKGNIKQLPPMYSAIKKNGVRLYELARQGIEIEREERDVTVYSLDLIKADEKNCTYEIEVACSSGTYIRSLVSDIGQALKCGAVMTKLVRTRANGIDIEDCYTYDQLLEMKNNGTLESAVIPVDRIIDYAHVTVSLAQSKRFFNGGELDLNRVKQIRNDGLYNVYSPEGEFLGVGLADKNEGILKVRRVYVK